MSNIITIDGPTSSGKSSVGHLFAQKIGYEFIDTGAIYRAGAIYILKHGILAEDENRVAEVFSDIFVKFETKDGRQRIYLDDEDITDRLHSPEVTSIVPIIAAHKKAREEAKKIQRKIGSLTNTVMTGRDIGSEIFPESKLKFFLTASPEVRAERRYDQLKKVNPEITVDEVLKDMLKRDEMDATREASPFRKPEDAIVIDTTSMTTEQSVDAMLKEYRRVFPVSS